MAYNAPALKQRLCRGGDSVQSSLPFSLSGPLQPWSSESSIGSKQLESKSETDGSSTPQNNGGVRLHEFVSKTVGLQAGRTWKRHFIPF